MANSEKLTLKQETYCLKRALEKLSQRQAYIEAFGRGNKTDKSIDELASRLEKTVKIQSRIAELQNSLAEKALWSKADMIKDLKTISDECKIAPVIVQYFGKGDNKGSEKRIDSKARSVAVNAIKTAGEMLGYKTADTEVNVTIKLEDIMKKVEGKEEY